MQKVSISIIVPIYNVEQYIRECLDSLVNQTLDSIEVLLVNDGTKDASGDIAEEYAKKWPDKFKYFKKVNGGLSDARNYAFPFVKGKYVAYLDSDDYVAPNMYSEMWKVAEETGADIIECELSKVYTKHIEEIYLPKKYTSYYDYMLNSRVCAWNKLFRVEWLKEIGIEFPKGLLYEDLCFFYKVTPYLNQIPYTIHECLYFYRQREGSILSNSNHRILEIHDIFDNIFKFYKDHEMSEEYIECAEYKYMKTLFCSFLLRMLKMKDKRIRREVIDASWKRFNNTRPNWKRNKYLKKLNLKNLYLIIMSKPILELMKLFVR